MALYLLNVCWILTDLVYNSPIAEVGTIAWEYMQPFHTLSTLRKVDITNTTSLLNTSNLHSLFSVKTLGLVCILNDHKQHLVGHWPACDTMPMCSDKSSVHDQQHTLRGAGKHTIGNLPATSPYIYWENQQSMSISDDGAFHVAQYRL